MSTKEFVNYVSECLSAVGSFSVRPMMGEYLLYYNGKLVGDICDNRVLVKQTETSCRLLSDCPLEYPYVGSKQLMFVVDDLENSEKMKELFDGLFSEIPEKRKNQGRNK